MKLDLCNSSISENDINSIEEKLISAYDKLLKRSGEGSEYTGWLDYSYDNNMEEYEKIKYASKKIMSDSEAVIVIGIGGSYLGARAAITSIKGEDYNDFPGNTPRIFFCGNSLSEKSLLKAKKIIETYNTSLIVISKSGTTIEPAITFRLLKNQMYDKYKNSACDRIYVITDEKYGALRKIADSEGMESFTVPGNIGGRYSVFTPVGLLPMACAGIAIDEITRGLKDAQKASGRMDAFVSAEGMLNGRPIQAGAFDFEFMGGSMGSVVGERFARGVQAALDNKTPFICVAASGGAPLAAAAQAFTSLLSDEAAEAFVTLALSSIAYCPPADYDLAVTRHVTDVELWWYKNRPNLIEW